MRLDGIEDYLDMLTPVVEEEEHDQEDAGNPQNGHPPLKGGRTLADSRIARNGLPAGTPAPVFKLPRPDGGELSLSEYRGKRVLLVFSDPHCGPCDALAPDLERAHRANSGVQVLLVSRGEIGDNRRKIKQFDLTFPIVLQRKWEISKRYAMFATPIGYLIDEQGITASEVALGADAILALLSGSTRIQEGGGREVTQWFSDATDRVST